MRNRTECYVECDNGFIATIRSLAKSELQELSDRQGLSKPHFLGGDAYYFWSMCIQLVEMGIAFDNYS